MGRIWVRVLVAAGVVICGTTSCMIVNLDGDDARHGACPGAKHEAKCGHCGASQAAARTSSADKSSSSQDSGTQHVGGEPEPGGPPGIRPGVVQIFKVVGATETCIGFGSQDPNDANHAHWVLANDQQYPVNIGVNQSLKLKLLQGANEAPELLCTRAKNAGIVGPKIWRVLQSVVSSLPCEE